MQNICTFAAIYLFVLDIFVCKWQRQLLLSELGLQVHGTERLQELCNTADLNPNLKVALTVFFK